MMHYIGIYLYCLGMSFRSLVRHRGSFLLGFFGQILVYGSEFLLMWLVIEKFGIVGGWKASEVLVLFSLNLISYGIAGFFFFSSVHLLGEKINTGELDNVLTKPLPSLFGLVTFNPNLGYIMHLSLSAACLVISLYAMGIPAGFGTIVFVILAVTGGVLIQASIFITSGVLNFWSNQAGSAVWNILWSVREFVRYPFTIYPTALRVFLTFVLPLGFISFYPAAKLLGRISDPFTGIISGISPLIGLVCFVLSYAFWRRGLRRYESTGS